MYTESIDSINENKSLFLLENNNNTFSINGNLFINLFNIYSNSNENKEDKETLKKKNIQSYFINKKEDEKINKNLEIPSDLRIKENENTFNKYDNRYDFLNKITENNEGNAPFLYTFEDILNIFKKDEYKNKFNEINKIYNNNKEIEEDNLSLEKKGKIALFEQEENTGKQLINRVNLKEKIEDNRKIKIKLDNNKRGRKTNEIKNIATHNKMAPDNIIKKIKAEIFKYPIVFLNNILDNNKKSEEKLFKINYQFINRLNREQDLKFLDMKLKELFSKEISPKYITDKRQKDFNKQYINRILNIQKDNTILFAFNITFRDWLDLFTLKKNIRQILIKYDYSDKDIDCERIQKSLYGVDNLLNKIMNANDKEYLTMFIFLLYNYERWFYKKIGRKTRIKKKI